MTAVSNHARYIAAAIRIEAMTEHIAPDGEARSYWRGFRRGMSRSTAPDQALQKDETVIVTLADALDSANGRIEAETMNDIQETAYADGYADGRRWTEPSTHRGLLRLVARRVTGGSARGLARRVLGIDERTMRRMLSAEQTISADVYAHLVDLLHGSDEWRDAP